MTRARVGALLGGLVVLALLAAWWGSPPDATPPEETAGATPGVTRPVPPTRPAVPPPSPAPEEVDWATVEAPETGEIPTPPPQPWTPPAIDTTRTADLGGVLAAALARRTRFRDCWWDYVARVGVERELDPLVVTMEVTLDDGGAPTVDTVVSSADSDPDLERCVAATMTDARFEGEAGVTVSVVWPVPVEELPAERR